MFVRGVSLQGPLLVLGRGCALVFGWGAEVLGYYVCSTQASLFLPFLIKFLEASLEFCLLFELVSLNSFEGNKTILLKYSKVYKI